MAIQALEHKQQYTSDDLWEWAQLPEYADCQLELIDGEIVIMSPSSAKPSMVGAIVLAYLSQFVREHDLGYVSGADGAYELSPGNTLAPDVAFVAKARLPKTPDRFFPLAPDLAVEVVSPTDSIKKTRRKAAKYLAAGTKLVLIVYPDDQTIDVCRPVPEGSPNAMLIEELTIDGVLDGGEALPGFQLAVRDVFKLLPETAEPKPTEAKLKKSKKVKKAK